MYFTANYASKQPFVSVTWLTPDGRKIRVDDFGVSKDQTLQFSQDQKLQKD